MIVPRRFGITVIQHGIDRHLIGDVDAAFVPGIHAQSCRQTAARAFAAHHDLAVVDAKLRGVFFHPAECGIAILQRRRIGCFDGQAVTDAHHQRAVLFHQRQRSGEVSHLRHAGSVSTAVNPEDSRCLRRVFLRCRWAENQNLNVRSSGWDFSFFNGVFLHRLTFSLYFSSAQALPKYISSQTAESSVAVSTT